jgi:hypothetical protein
VKRCEHCQLDFPDAVTFCRNCGQSLVESSDVSEEMVFCPLCGSRAKSTWRFCRRCGAQMEEAEDGPGAGPPPRRPAAPASTGVEPRIHTGPHCPRCHLPLRAEARFCDGCGAPLGGAVPIPPTEPIAPLPVRETAPTEPVTVSEPVELSLGGYAQDGGASGAAALAPEERRTFRRLTLGVLMVAIVAALVLAVRFWPTAPARTGANQPRSTPSAPLRDPEASTFFPVTFDTEPIEMEDPLAGGHAHHLVTLDEQALFIIRDEGEHHSTAERAEEVADRLRQAMTNLRRDPKAEFRVENRSGVPTIVQAMPSLVGAEEWPIVSITAPDVSAYNRRSRRRVTAAQLAEWWLNRLKDRVALFVQGRAPRLTVEDPDGRALAELYERAKNESRGGQVTPEALGAAWRSLPAEPRRLLSETGVRAVPHHGEDHQ